MKKTVRRIAVSFWLGVLIGVLLLGSLIGPVSRQAKANEQQVTITLTVTTSDQGCIVPFDEYPMKFEDVTLSTRGTEIARDLQIGRRETRISISMPGKPKVKISKVVTGTSEEDSQSWFATKEGIAWVDFNSGPDSTNVVVYLSGLCDEGNKEDEKEKEIKVVVSSLECKSSPQWSGVGVLIDNRLIRTEDAEMLPQGNGAFRMKDIKVSPGEKSIKVVPSLDFPLTKIESVQVFKMFTGNIVKTVGGLHYIPDASGGFTVSLDKTLWEKTKRFVGLALDIELSGNCADPETNPREFALVRVKAVSGDVEFVEPFSGRPVKSNAGDRYLGGTIIKTGKDGLIDLESEYKHTISIDSSTQVELHALMTPAGRKQLTVIKRGKIKIARNVSDSQTDSTDTTVQTDTATVSSPHTIYSVNYDESTKLTTVGVDEGQVKVFPENEALQPVTLAANQQVQVSDKSISDVTSYTGELGSRTSPLLLYVGIGAATLVGLLVVVGGITFLYRRVNRAPVQPAFQQSGIKVEAAPAKFAEPAVATNEWHCPNPQCGKLVPATKKFCTACGTQSGFKVKVTPAYVASPAVATRERRCPNPQCGKLVAARKKFCTACGASVI